MVLIKFYTINQTEFNTVGVIVLQTACFLIVHLLPHISQGYFGILRKVWNPLYSSLIGVK